MLKIKHRRSVDCVVGGYRVHKDGDKIGSILLGSVSGRRVDLPRALLGLLRPRPGRDAAGLRGDPRRRFLWRGRSSPGAESRWSGGKDLSWVPVLPGVVVRDLLRPIDERAVPSRHPVRALAARQGCRRVHHRSIGPPRRARIRRGRPGVSGNPAPVVATVTTVEVHYANEIHPCTGRPGYDRCRLRRCTDGRRHRSHPTALGVGSVTGHLGGTRRPTSR